MGHVWLVSVSMLNPPPGRLQAQGRCSLLQIALRHPFLRASTSVAWSQAREAPRIATAAWDGSVRVWDPAQPGKCITSWDGAHGGGYVYDARWSPHRPGVLASAGADGTVRVWDVRQRAAVAVS